MYPHKRHVAAVGFDRDDMTLSPITYDEMRPGCYDPKARLDDMDVNHVEASLCFPTFPRFCGQTFTEAKDKDLALACVQAYNDWMVEEWCGDCGGASSRSASIPLWDAELAAAEVRRNAARGVRAVCFSEIPPNLGLPSIHTGYWDPFFAACAGHRARSSACTSARRRRCRPPRPTPRRRWPPRSASTTPWRRCRDFLFSGVLVRFPTLKLAYSEGQIGWMPYVLERADDVWQEHRAWGGVADHVPEPPSTYYYRQVYGCFFRDRHGLDALDKVGVDNITFETDYPHTDSTWPNTLAVAEDLMGHLPQDVVDKICRGNALRMLGLT